MSRLFKMAIVGGVDGAVRLHIERGDDLNARDDRGFTPLMLAAARNRPAISRMLIEAGADLQAVDPAGRNALRIGRDAGANEAVEVLEAAERARRETDALSHVDDAAILAEGLGATSAVLPLNDEHRGAATVAFDGLASTPNDDDDWPGARATLDLLDWIAEPAETPPVGDETLLLPSAAVQQSIGAHAALDDSEDWSDFEAWLPEEATPFPHVEDAEASARLRLLLLRAWREGSLPSMSLNELYPGVDEDARADLLAPLRVTLADLPAELDERLEYRDRHDNLEPYIDERESAAEEEAVDDALTFLENIEARRNDPMRLYMREVQRGALIDGSKEQALAQAMERAEAQALDALASWPLGISKVLEAVERVRSGERLLGWAMAGPRGFEEPDAMTVDDESVQLDTQVSESESEALSGEGNEESEKDAVEAANLSTFLGLAADLQVLSIEALHGAAAEKRREVLRSMSLTRSLLLCFADGAKADEAPAVREFTRATRDLAAARDQMAKANLRLVLSISKRYAGSGVPLDDLVQEGNIGLLKAVDKFDWRRGFKFSTMATWWIRQQVSRMVADTALLIRLPVHVYEVKVVAIRQAMWSAGLSPADRPSPALIADLVGLPTKQVDRLVRAISAPLSMEELDEELAQREDVAAEPFDDLDSKQLQQAVAHALGQLDERQGEVMRKRYGIGSDLGPRTLEEVSHDYGLTRERIRQIEAKAVRRLLHPNRRRDFSDWLDLDRASTESEKQAKEWLERAASAGAEPSALALEGAALPTSDSSADEIVVESSTAEDDGLIRIDVEPSPERLAEPEDLSSTPEFGKPGCALHRLLSDARERGSVVEQSGSGLSKATWVNLDGCSETDRRKLTRRLLEMGFRHWPGKGYWR